MIRLVGTIEEDNSTDYWIAIAQGNRARPDSHSLIRLLCASRFCIPNVQAQVGVVFHPTLVSQSASALDKQPCRFRRLHRPSSDTRWTSDDNSRPCLRSANSMPRIYHRILSNDNSSIKNTPAILTGLQMLHPTWMPHLVLTRTLHPRSTVSPRILPIFKVSPFSRHTHLLPVSSHYMPALVRDHRSPREEGRRR